MNFERGGTGLLAIAALLILPSCTPSEAPRVALTPKSNPIYNQTALFLAGMKGPDNSPFHSLEGNPEWRKYAADFDATWSRAAQEHLSPVDTFQKRDLAPLQSGASFVFYPFGGPDVLYATRFFPECRVYVLAGLERVGDIAGPEQFQSKKLEREFNGWRKALASIFERSFFVTSEMDSQFHGRVANGLLPMILLLLSRSGYAIEDVRYGHLDPGGAMVYEQATSNIRHMGVEIDFHRGAEAVTRKLFYFSTRLGPEFQQDPSFARFLDRLGKPDTLVKSGSFLLHWEMCKALRSYILNNSNLILEDDTGVPYRYFQNADWRVQLFGEYSRPDPPFRLEYQHDLASAFSETSKVKPLGFNLGYGAGRRPSSMLLAVRTR